MTTIEYLFSCLGEEGAEISQCTSKINRFGIDDVYTHIAEDGTMSVKTDRGTNRSRLIQELNDFEAVVTLLVWANQIPENWRSADTQSAKLRKIHRYLEYAKKVGAVKDYND